MTSEAEDRRTRRLRELVEKWQAVADKMCPSMRQPETGWTQQDYMDRTAGAMIAAVLYDLAAVLDTEGDRPAPTKPQRYDLVTNYRCGDAIEEMEWSDDGEWVRYEDVFPDPPVQP